MATCEKPVNNTSPQRLIKKQVKITNEEQINDEKCPQCKPESVEKLKNDESGYISWLQCEQCETWIHAVCEDFDETQVSNSENYFCQTCQKQGHNFQKSKNDFISQNKDENQSKSPTKQSNENDEENEIIPSSQPPPNPYSVKQKGKTEKQDKSEALHHRTKAHILKEYKKLENKIKERDTKITERDNKIDDLKKEIEKLNEQHEQTTKTLDKLTKMKDTDDQSKIKIAIEAQRESEKQAAETVQENQKLKKNNTDKQTEIRKLKEQLNQIEQKYEQEKIKYEKEFKEKATLENLLDLTKQSKKAMEEKYEDFDEKIKNKAETITKLNRQIIAKDIDKIRHTDRIKELEHELEKLADLVYNDIDTYAKERKDTGKENCENYASEDTLHRLVNSSISLLLAKYPCPRMKMMKL